MADEDSSSETRASKSEAAQHRRVFDHWIMASLLAVNGGAAAILAGLEVSSQWAFAAATSFILGILFALTAGRLAALRFADDEDWYTRMLSLEIRGRLQEQLSDRGLKDLSSTIEKQILSELETAANDLLTPKKSRSNDVWIYLSAIMFAIGSSLTLISAAKTPADAASPHQEITEANLETEAPLNPAAETTVDGQSPASPPPVYEMRSESPNSTQVESAPE
ncbi:hypothetical protein HFP57_16965 [Parasphingopyxis algicola]|uniref:hypothetical protein n=1 Tax=Parasphingopyxis algicola TaxID=2026624 RepID=UPI0015A2B0F2|nr:hypothetical protein [Parasphingopyxis algicola]QLC26557.1 hypothetical protein HFP57_16965 [Parasphingopyxis algicola]